jgi:hypothetical protein
VEALLTGQEILLSFGFQSTLTKLEEMSEPNVKVLDGRTDVEARVKGTQLVNHFFEPKHRRFREVGELVVILMSSIGLNKICGQLNFNVVVAFLPCRSKVAKYYSNQDQNH